MGCLFQLRSLFLPSGLFWSVTSLQISEIPHFTPADMYNYTSADMYVPEDDVVTVSVETFPQSLSGARGIADNKTNIVCFGDSITHGLCGSMHGSYPEQLQMQMGEDYVVTKVGACGRTIMKTGPQPIWKEHHLLESAENSLPDIVVLMFGTNDAKSKAYDPSLFKADYTTLIQQFQAAASSPRVYVMSPPPIYNGAAPWMETIGSHINTKEIDGLVREIASENGLDVPIDLFTLFKSECDHFDRAECRLISHKDPPSGGECVTCDNDGKHPNDEGYEKIAELVKNRIKQNIP